MTTSTSASGNKKPDQRNFLRLLYCLDGWHLVLQHHWHTTIMSDLWDIHGFCAL